MGLGLGSELGLGLELELGLGLGLDEAVVDQPGPGAVIYIIRTSQAIALSQVARSWRALSEISCSRLRRVASSAVTASSPLPCSSCSAPA